MEWPLVGEWWSATYPQVRRGGTLELSPDGTLQLRTHGDVSLDHRLEDGTFTIFGVAQRREITVRRAYFAGSRGDQYEWGAVDAVIGGHFAEDQRFASVIASSQHLDKWVDNQAWSIDHPRQESDDYEVRLEVSRLSGPIGTEEYDKGDVAVVEGLTWTAGKSEFVARRSTGVRVRPKGGATLDELELDVRHLAALMTTIFGESTSADDLRLQLDDEPHKRIEWVGRIASPEHAALKTLAVELAALCSYEQFGRLSGIAAWFGLRPPLRHLAARVASHYQRRGRFLEDIALAVFAAGEAIDRTETGAKNTPARTRWRQLASQIPEFAADFAEPSVADWAHLLVTERDNLAHVYTWDTEDDYVDRIWVLAETAHLLSVLSLYRIAGLGSSVQGMQASHRWKNQVHSCHEVMRRLGQNASSKP